MTLGLTEHFFVVTHTKTHPCMPHCSMQTEIRFYRRGILRVSIARPQRPSLPSCSSKSRAPPQLSILFPPFSKVGWAFPHSSENCVTSYYTSPYRQARRTNNKQSCPSSSTPLSFPCCKSEQKFAAKAVSCISTPHSNVSLGSLKSILEE